MTFLKKYPLSLILVLIGFGMWWRMPVELKLGGEVFGTYYSITAYVPHFFDETTLERRFKERLESIDRSMSTYREDSELSQFNASRNVSVISVSTDLYQVLSIGHELYYQTGGAWDATVLPIYKLWQFDQTEVEGYTPPSRRQIRRVIGQVGFRKISLVQPGQIQKIDPTVKLDLSSVAKGYAVDELGRILKELSVETYFVDIGGEVLVSGLRPGKKPWRVGIQKPSLDGGVEVYRIVNVSNKAVATSGDYRHYHEFKGQILPHVINPKTGYPVSHHIASATVIANDSATADGLATALMVMPPEEGIALIETMKDVEALVIVRESDGKFVDYMSTKFPDYF